MANNLQDLGSPSSHANKAGQPHFQANKISEVMISKLNEKDIEGRQMREQLKSSCESYKDNVQFANNHFAGDQNVKEIIFRAKKAFFNHKFSTQELLRSQHLYKLVHELKYTPEKNLKSYPDVLEDGYKEVLRVNDKDYEIRDALVKWYEHRQSMISFVQKELQRQYFQLFACELDEYSENSKNIALQLKQSEEVLLEVEDVIRNLKSERFFRNSKQYERKHLPELSVVSAGNVIIEKTYAKALKNFPYITQQHIKIFFNDYVSQHYCTRKIKKIRLINDYLPYKIQFLNTMKTAKSIQLHSKNNYNFEQDEILREINKLYGVRRTYLLASDKSTVEKNVADFSKQLGIKEDINIDYGCLLLFAIDKKFETVIKDQSETYLQFYPYDLKSPFMNMVNQKKFGDQANELMKTIESENRRKDNIKIRSCKTWIDKLQILQAEDPEVREQNAVFALYEDTLINGWLKFLLYNDENLINQKIQKDISVLKDRIMAIHKKQFEEIFYQFYQRYFKLLFLKSRKSVIKLMSYMNYFRCLQKNMNLAYVQLIIGQSIEGSQDSKGDAKYSEFDATLPLHQQQEKISQNKLHDERFFLTNPSIANYGNLTQYNQNKGVKSSKEDYIKIDGQATVYKDKNTQVKSSGRKMNDSQAQKGKKREDSTEEDAYEEPNVLYEEEVIQLENDIITIRDHNDMKIFYDTSIHDFHMVLEKIGQICSFYFHFRIKHDMSQKDKDKGIFKDTFDREALIDIVLNLESQFYLNKVKLLRNLTTVLKNTFYPDLRNQLIRLISNIMARRPRMNLFENSIFQCYHFEIQNLAYFNEIVEILLKDLETEEDKVYQIRRKLNPSTADRLHIFLQQLKNPEHERKFSYYSSSLAKLIINIEQNRGQFQKLITSAQTEPTVMISEILKCENAYFKELLDVTKKVTFDSDGSNLYLDFLDFRFIEKEETLDQPENFDLIMNKVQTYIDERLSKAEREKLSFDAFSMLEFMKVRKKFNNFLFGLSGLLETYRLQAGRISEDFKEKFENQIDITSIPTVAADAQRKNYLRLFLDVDAIKIAKDILVLDNWVVPITKQQSLIQLTQYLESLILCSQLTQNYVISNNIYFQSILNDMPKEYFKKIKQSAPDYFRNIFDKKKQISNETITYVRNQELSKPKVNTQEEGSGKIFTIQVFCKRLKREVQFEAMKIQTLLQRNAIEKFSKKLPFEHPLFKFTQLSPVKEITITIQQQKDSLLDVRTHAQIDEDLDSKGEVFFDTLGCAVKIFNMPSVEQILNMTHDDFEQVMERYGMNKLPEDSDDDYFGDEEQKWEKSQTSGGKDWLKAQEQKLEKDTCLLLPNRNIQVNKGSTTLKGFRKREFLQHQHLLYLRKTQLFVLWKILGNLLNVLSFCTFECSLEANAMDMLYFTNGQLGFEKCKIDAVGVEDPEQKSTSNVKSLKDLAMVNKKAIPVFKRNELRLRRDIENLKTLLERVEKNIQIIRNNPKIADSNDAIMSYLEKVQNRHFLSVLLLLLEQLNISREKEDYEYMYRLRSLIIDLNFPQMSNLAKFEDGKILLAKNIVFNDNSADFTQSPDLKVYDSSSDFMNLIRVIFWDQRPKIEENLHSTIAILNPNRYFFQQFMKFGSILEKGLIGMPQSRITELSVTKNSMDFIVNNFLRNNFVFEQDDPFKYERMCTKIINLQVRQYILREIYISRKLNILPFEIIPGNKDPLKEISKLIKDKIKITKAMQNGLSSNLSSKQQIEKKALTNGNNQEIQEPPPEENVRRIFENQSKQINNKLFIKQIILDLSLNAFQLQQLMYQEAIDFYYEENLVMSKWINIARKQDTTNTLRNMVYDPLSLNKAFSTGSLQVLDILSILSNFTTKVFFDSTEVKTLNKNEALVISKEDLKKHLHGINLDLIDLIEEKYSKSIKNMEQKCDILENDVVFQKKWNKLLQKKIEFLEKNIQNIVESQVASRSNDLIYEIQNLQKRANYTADQRQIDKVRIFKEIQKNFSDQLRENELVNENMLSRFYDFRQGQKLEVYNMVEGIKDYNYKLLKEAISKALEDHGGSSQALHAVDGIWNSTLGERKEDDQKKKQNATQQSQPTQQQQLTQQQTISQRMMRTTHTEESAAHYEEENAQNAGILPSQQMMHIPISQQNVQLSTQQNIGFMGASIPNPMFDYNNVDTLPADCYERIEFQNKEVYRLLSSFKLIRAFSNMKMACMVEKYERQIQQINENNSSNEQLYRDKKEMQAQTESMKDQLLSLKKTMAIMEYQNEILRRDVQRSRKERLKAMKVMKQKDDKIRGLEEKVEQNLKDRIATYNNLHSINHISRNFSVQSLRKKHNKTLGNSVQNGGTLNQIDSSFVIQQSSGNVLPQSILKPQYYTQNMNIATIQSHQMTQSSQLQNQRTISSAHPVLANSQVSQSSQIQPNLQNKRPTTALVTSKSTQLFQTKQSALGKQENTTERKLSPPPAASNYQSNISQQQSQSKKKHMHLSGLLTRPVSSQSTPANKQLANPKTLSMTYKIKNANAPAVNQQQN